MGIFEAVLLGAIQGITEFLPVSSSGHLLLLQKILGISEPALLFDTVVHGGTLIAVFVVLWEDIWRILRRPIQRLTGFLILGTVPAVVAALLFKRQIDEVFEPDSSMIGMVLGLAFLLTSALLAGSQVLSHKPGAFRGQRNMNWLDALVIGVLQAVGITPGVSRSGATLSGALFRRLDRDFAARFSFLLSIPAILGALVLQLKDLLETRGDVALGVETTGGGIGPGALIAGTLTAAVVGFFAVRFMLKLVKERSLWGFVVYTGVLGILVLADRFVTHFYF